MSFCWSREAVAVQPRSPTRHAVPSSWQLAHRAPCRDGTTRNDSSISLSGFLQVSYLFANPLVQSPLPAPDPYFFFIFFSSLHPPPPPLVRRRGLAGDPKLSPSRSERLERQELMRVTRGDSPLNDAAGINEVAARSHLRTSLGPLTHLGDPFTWNRPFSPRPSPFGSACDTKGSSVVAGKPSLTLPQE